jgi:uncharacterized protein
MKQSGTHKFKASSTQVFQAILDPAILKASIPGCSLVEYTTPDRLNIEISTSIPGLKGPYLVTLNIVNRQAPSHLELQLARQGRGGTINATALVNLVDEADGALLTYDANADLSGTVAVINNPIGQGILKNMLSGFFKNLDKSIEAAYV